ncbi:hypothetical protein [Albibacterium profundi]|uniref:TonB C-terminal domain-containing protein n=1 Tax=Albibacterium profundi TaxID=3134906 RepID=A0ABV5CGN6_9SPHI
MKNLLMILFMLPTFVFGQQFLWSTTNDGELKDKNINNISVDAVLDKVLSYYDFYNYYHDMTGFTIDGLKEFIETDPKAAKSIQWKPTMKFDKPTAFAFKGNDGYGSYVIVMLMQQENVDLLMFSNDIGQGVESTNYGHREKFISWFHSFWRYGEISYTSEGGDPLLADYGYATTRLENRRFIVAPKIEDDGEFSGKVAVEIRVDREGKVLSARAGVRGTTISDNALYERCERAVLGAQLNQVEMAPSIQTGVIVFNFKLK